VAHALQRALQVADDDQLVLVTGSLYLVGTARTLLQQ
jgi:folylpolyglutamate synthase/dihydropteroate synthase